MKASQRKRRIAPPILDITRLALSPGDVLVIRVKESVTAEERQQMSRFLGRAAGVNSMITDDVIDMAVLQAPPAPIVISEDCRQATALLHPDGSPVLVGDLPHHPV